MKILKSRVLYFFYFTPQEWIHQIMKPNGITVLAVSVGINMGRKYFIFQYEQ